MDRRQGPRRRTAHNDFADQSIKNEPLRMQNVRDKQRQTDNNNLHTEKQPIAKVKHNIIKLVIILLLALNLICVSAIALLNAYTLNIRNEKEREHTRLVNHHPLYFRNLIENNAKLYNLHEAYISAIIKNESSFKTDARSSVGALGLMQLMPDTADWIAGKLKIKNFSFENLADPELNMQFGSWYLSFLSERFNADPVLTTAAYHTGQGKVANWLADKSISKDGRTIKQEDLPDGPTKTYVERVLKAYEVYNALYFDSAQSN